MINDMAFCVVDLVACCMACCIIQCLKLPIVAWLLGVVCFRGDVLASHSPGFLLVKCNFSYRKQLDYHPSQTNP